MSLPESELRATSDSLLSALDRLAAVEADKRALPPDDPKIVELAREVQVLASVVLAAATDEAALAETAHVMAQTDQPDAPSKPIDAVPRSLQAILDDWRAAERDLADAPPGSLEAAEAQARSRAYRSEYQRAFEEVTRERAPES
jgi:hypothetical protein